MSGNVLKIIASISMLLDHMGVILFPEIRLFRIIGRLAFPIFAFMISEGCTFTKNKPRYFFSVFSLALLCQLFYFIFERSLYMSVLVTFSLSIITVYALNYFKASKNMLSFSVFVITVALVYVLNIFLEIDYGFWGCMAGVFASLITDNSKKFLRIFLFSIGLVILALNSGTIQLYSLLSLLLLLLYSGKRGKLKMKYFFYAFYPLHIAVLEVINMIIN